MGQFQISENLQLEHLLFIDKGYLEKLFQVTLFTFCLTKPIDTE